MFSNLAKRFAIESADKVIYIICCIETSLQPPQILYFTSTTSDERLKVYKQNILPH